jgi:hypothetical protein
MNLGKYDVKGMLKIFMFFAVFAMIVVTVSFTYPTSADADNAKISETKVSDNTKVSDKMKISDNTDNLVTAAGTDDGAIEWSLFFDDYSEETNEDGDTVVINNTIQKSAVDYSYFKTLYESKQSGQSYFIYVDLYASYTGENTISVGALCGFLHYDTSVFKFVTFKDTIFNASHVSADANDGAIQEGQYLRLSYNGVGDLNIGAEKTLICTVMFKVTVPETVAYNTSMYFDFYDDGNDSHLVYPTSVEKYIEYTNNTADSLNIIGQITLYEKSTLTMVTADGLITAAITERGGYDVNMPIYLTGIFLGQTVENLKENFINQNIVILNASGTAAADTDAIGTGWRIVIYNSDNVVADAITIILRGDVNGDGSINVQDISLINHNIDSLKSTGAYLLAADVYKDGRINFIDKKLVSDNISGLPLYDPSITSTMRGIKSGLRTQRRNLSYAELLNFVL